MSDKSDPTGAPGNDRRSVPPGDAPEKPIPADAQRALDEAAARRAALEAAEAARPRELNGPKGPEPTRYGDWEKKGIASDF